MITARNGNTDMNGTVGGLRFEPGSAEDNIRTAMRILSTPATLQYTGHSSAAVAK